MRRSREERVEETLLERGAPERPGPGRESPEPPEQVAHLFPVVLEHRRVPGDVARLVAAPQAAGAIHTDFERGFIRAEVIAFQDYLAGKGEAGAKDAGKLRLEGKEYVVQEGDVMHFRFNV